MRVNIYYSLIQAIINQEYNVVKAIKNTIIKIKKDRELKGNLKSKEWENAFIDIRKLFKITYKINKIKIVQDIVKKEWGEELLEHRENMVPYQWPQWLVVDVIGAQLRAFGNSTD